MNTNTVETTQQIADVASKASHVGTAGAVIFGLSYSELGMLLGLCVSVLGFLVNWYYRHKEYLLKERQAGLDHEI